MEVQVVKRPFTVQEYHLMAEAGILTENDRVELIHGEIINMSPIGNRHLACVNRLTMLLAPLLNTKAIVSVQNPVRVDEYSEPEPDVTLLKLQSDFYAQEGIKPQNVFLIIEISDSTLDYDRKIKLPLYAEAGISEIWIVNLPEEQVETYTQPANGIYQQIEKFKRGMTIPLFNHQHSIAVQDILG